MSWIDKLLIKIALAKLAARGGNPRFAVLNLTSAFETVNSSSDIPPSSGSEELLRNATFFPPPGVTPYL